MRRPALLHPDMYATTQSEFDYWSNRLLDAFSNAKLRSGFLPIAEQAVEHCPGDAYILLMAATAALLDRKPERALVFLKQFSKRATAKAEPLLHALALGQLEKYVEAKALLDRHKLTTWLAVVRVFPGGPGRRVWITEQ